MARKRVVILARDSLNNGDMAMVEALVRSLHARMGDRLDMTLLSTNPAADAVRYESGLKLTIHSPGWTVGVRPRVLEYVSFLYAVTVGSRAGEIIQGASLVVDVSGDSLSSTYGLPSFLACLYPLRLARRYGVPYFICAQSLGPFVHITKAMASAILRDAAHVTVREPKSLGIVQQLGASATLTADLAFLLDSDPEFELKVVERLLEGRKRPILGITPSGLFAEQVETIAAFVRRWLIEIGGTIVLVPHVYRRRVSDVDAADRIVRRIMQQGDGVGGEVLVVQDRLTARQCKALISKLDVLVSFRMHAGIAAVSSGVPALLLSYSHKSEGIFGEMLGLGDYVVGVADVSPELLQEKCVELLNRKAEIASMLEARVRVLREKAYQNIEWIVAALT